MALEFNYKVGDRLIVELENDIFEGDYCGGNKDRIDLTNVSEYPVNEKFFDKLSFYRLEIISVAVLNDVVEETVSSTTEEVINVCKNEYNRLKQMTTDYIYMPTIDNRYVEATQHLTSCESVSVVGLGGEFGRMKSLSLLILASWDQVYIFDLFLYRNKEFPTELRNILESNFIKKIVHDSRALVDCLYHRHQVQMKNIFDTQGCTVDCAVVYLGNKLFQPGQAYVALSRVRSLEGVRIVELDCSKLTGKKPCNEDALREMERMRNYQPPSEN